MKKTKRRTYTGFKMKDNYLGIEIKSPPLKKKTPKKKTITRLSLYDAWIIPH